MSNLIENVREFTKIAGCTVDEFNPAQAALYMGLVREEDSEWMEEVFRGHYPEWLPVKISDLKGMASLFKSGEFNGIIKDVDRAKLAHELADLAWVTIGALFSLGVDVEGVFNELARANMDKAVDCQKCRGEGFYIQDDMMTDGTCPTCNGTGKVMLKNEYGKVVKPHGWRKADMTPFVKVV